MRTAARRCLISFLAGVGVLAAAGSGLAVTDLSTGGTARAGTLAGGGRVAPDGLFRPIIATPRYTPPAAPRPRPARAAVVAAAKPPPVVNGVRRSNVGAAHSPQLSRDLSGGRQRPPGSLLPGAARGIDVASYQHQHGAAINWARVARAGYKFVFIKAAEGNYYANPYYATDVAQAKAAGLYATGYTFAVPNVSGGADQAEYAVQHARGRTMPLALDIEYNPYGRECYGLTPTRMVGWLAAFTGEVRRLTGHRPIIYSTADWWRTCTGDSRAFGADPLWVAAWGASPPPLPSGWRNWTFWQFTSRGRVPGIQGNVDISYYRRRLPAPAPAPAPAPSSTAPRPSPSPTSSSPSPTPSSPTPTPSPSPTPSSPTPTPSSPTPTPSSPSPSQGGPSATASSPSPMPGSPSATPGGPVQSAASRPQY
jgi:GH25 family lysozyme M1 (1,4-beta-N-acetylmuramidase)